MKGIRLIMHFNIEDTSREIDMVRVTKHFDNIMLHVKDYGGYFVLRTNQLWDLMSGRIKSIPLYTRVGPRNATEFEVMAE